MKMAITAILVMLQLIRTAYPCSMVGDGENLGMERTLYQAPAVVIATDIYHSLTWDDEAPVDSEDNYAILSVDCIMKSGGYTIERNITIWEGALRDSAACQPTELEVGTSYVIGLELDLSVSSDSFMIYEPNVLTKGAFEATQETLDAVVQICGLDVSQGVEGATAVCPTGTEEDCTGTGSVLAAVMGMNLCALLTALLFVVS